MIDNEKRAHDLAMAYINAQFSSEIIKVRPTAQKDINDFSLNYCDIYLFILDHLNQNLV